jgi:predicted HicB family RNase H-like nuclease
MENVKEARSVVALNLRLDRSLHRLLKTEARRSVRSLNGEIVSRLQWSLDRRPDVAPAGTP